MLNLQDSIERGDLRGRVVLVLSSRPDAAGVRRALDRGLEAKVVERRRYDTPGEFSDVVWQAVREVDADVVALAGFLSMLVIPDDYRGRVVNIHPALLPSFGGHGMFGRRVHEAVLARGCRVSGCTVHLCDNAYDNGPILVQRTCPVLEDDTPDTLAARVFEQECLAYPEALRMLADGRVVVALQHNRARILPPAPERVNADPVARAAWYAKHAHAGQTRDDRPDGTPYTEHVEAVAATLREHGVTDPVVLAAAYLHDVVEKTPVSARQIRWAFGPAVAALVDELTLPRETGMTGPQKHAALMAEAPKLSDSARLIKLADRLDNVRYKQATLAAGPWRDYAKATGELLEALKPWPNPELAAAVTGACVAR